MLVRKEHQPEVLEQVLLLQKLELSQLVRSCKYSRCGSRYFIYRSCWNGCRSRSGSWWWGRSFSRGKVNVIFLFVVSLLLDYD